HPRHPGRDGSTVEPGPPAGGRAGARGDRPGAQVRRRIRGARGTRVAHPARARPDHRLPLPAPAHPRLHPMSLARPRPLVDAKLAAERGPAPQTLPVEAVGVDVDELITLRTPEDVADRRARLVSHLWKGTGLPSRGPQVQTDIAVGDLSSLPHARID